MFEKLKPQDFAKHSVLSEVAYPSYQTITVSLLLETMQRLHLRPMSYTIMCFSPLERLMMSYIASTPITMIPTQPDPTGELLSLSYQLYVVA